jgi:hypothetical protein
VHRSLDADRIGDNQQPAGHGRRFNRDPPSKLHQQPDGGESSLDWPTVSRLSTSIKRKETLSVRILSIAGDPQELGRCNDVLRGLGHVVHGVSKRDSIVMVVTEYDFDAVVICDDLPTGYVQSLAEEIRQLRPALRVLRLSETATEQGYFTDRFSNVRTPNQKAA